MTVFELNGWLVLAVPLVAYISHVLISQKL